MAWMAYVIWKVAFMKNDKQEDITSNEIEMSEAELDEISGGISDLDKIGDMSQIAQMKLQEIMERRSKFSETLSNVMKKMSSASDTITKNSK